MIGLEDDEIKVFFGLFLHTSMHEKEYSQLYFSYYILCKKAAEFLTPPWFNKFF